MLINIMLMFKKKILVIDSSCFKLLLFLLQNPKSATSPFTILLPLLFLLHDFTQASSTPIELDRASGPGGQHRNKRESAVHLKHLPTGIIAQVCLSTPPHSYRSQRNPIPWTHIRSSGACSNSSSPNLP